MYLLPNSVATYPLPLLQLPMGMVYLTTVLLISTQSHSKTHKCLYWLTPIPHVHAFIRINSWIDGLTRAVYALNDNLYFRDATGFTNFRLEFLYLVNRNMTAPKLLLTLMLCSLAMVPVSAFPEYYRILSQMKEFRNSKRSFGSNGNKAGYLIL